MDNSNNYNVSSVTFIYSFIWKGRCNDKVIIFKRHFQQSEEASISWLASTWQCVLVYNNNLLYNMVGCIHVQQQTITEGEGAQLCNRACKWVTIHGVTPRD